MNLQEIFSLCNYICNKSQSGKSFTPDEFRELLPVASTQLFRILYPDFEKKQLFTDALMPFKVYMGQEEYTDNNGIIIPAKAPLMIDVNGYANIPNDYKHYSEMTFKLVTNTSTCEPLINYRKVIPLTDQEFAAYNSSIIKKPTIKYPVCNFQNGFIRFLPKNLQYIDFVYLKNPITPVYGYIIDPITDQAIYNPATSIQLEWREDEQLDIVNILLQFIGINLSSTLLYQYATAKSNEDKINNQR